MKTRFSILKNVGVAGVAMLMSAQQSFAQQEFTIQGKFAGQTDDKKAVLSYFEGGERIEKTAAIKNGQFTLKGSVSYPHGGMLRFIPLDPPPIPADKNTSADIMERIRARDEVSIFLEEGNISVTGDNAVKTAKIAGGVGQSEYNAYKQKTKVTEDEWEVVFRKMVAAMRAKDSAALKEVDVARLAINRKGDQITADFIRNNPDSYVSWQLAEPLLRNEDVMVADKSLKAMSKRLQNSVQGRDVAKYIATGMKARLGQPAPQFTQNNTAGKPVSLASFRGKYVLLDFWASWCAPCREENPNVVKAYHHFREKNMEIISISLDSQKKPWLDAIKKDGMPWVHVSDLKGTKNSVAVNYGVLGIPQNFLIDPSGKIIARNLRGEELIPELEKLIK